MDALQLKDTVHAYLDIVKLAYFSVQQTGMMDCGTMDGGCVLLAKALERTLRDKKFFKQVDFDYAVFINKQNGQYEHFALRISHGFKELYIDGDGPSYGSTNIVAALSKFERRHCYVSTATKEIIANSEAESGQDIIEMITARAHELLGESPALSL